MQKYLRILGALVVIGVAFWAWREFFPGPETAIRRRISALAKIASFPPHQGNLMRIADTERLSGFFTPDVVITADVPGHGQHSIESRQELLQAVMSIRSRLDGLKVEFLDVNVTLGPDKQTATVDLTGKATIPGQSDFSVQELNFSLKKVEGKWVIYKVETVKTLSTILPFAA